MADPPPLVVYASNMASVNPDNPLVSIFAHGNCSLNNVFFIRQFSSLFQFYFLLFFISFNFKLFNNGFQNYKSTFLTFLRWCAARPSFKSTSIYNVVVDISLSLASGIFPGCELATGCSLSISGTNNLVAVFSAATDSNQKAPIYLEAASGIAAVFPSVASVSVDSRIVSTR